MAKHFALWSSRNSKPGHGTRDLNFSREQNLVARNLWQVGCDDSPLSREYVCLGESKPMLCYKKQMLGVALPECNVARSLQVLLQIPRNIMLMELGQPLSTQSCGQQWQVCKCSTCRTVLRDHCWFVKELLRYLSLGTPPFWGSSIWQEYLVLLIQLYWKLSMKNLCIFHLNYHASITRKESSLVEKWYGATKEYTNEVVD